MKYDFETIIDRTEQGSKKWAGMKKKWPDTAPDVLPMSTADMEFANAPEIREGLKEYVEHTVLGYINPTQDYFDAVLNWQKERHNFEAKQEWIVTAYGVIPAIHSLINLLSKPGEGVIVQQPVYYPFSMLVKMSGRKVINNELRYIDGHYEMDYEDLEKKAADPDTRLMIFCNPHNPAGRVWTKEELQKMVEICIRNNVYIIDDEIHNDLIMPGYKQTVLPSLSPEAAGQCAYCTAPSKTFNLAGMQLANIFIADPEIRGKYAMMKMASMDLGQVAVSYEACRLAYEKAGDWLDELVEVVDENAKYVESFMAENMPEVYCLPLEGTYLQWVDFRGLGMTHKELGSLMNDAMLDVDEGPIFGKGGRGFERFNLAMPHSAVEAAMNRLLEAYKKMQKKWEKEGRPEHITLEVGMRMPEFTYDTPFSTGKSFMEATKGTRTVLIFHRYYSCSLCAAGLRSLAEGYDEILAAGGQIKCVLQSKPQSISEALNGENTWPFELICDPERKLYDRFNIFTADSQMELLGDNMQAAMSMMGTMSVSDGGQSEGAIDQMPAFIIIDEEGIIRHIHYGTSVFDTPSCSQLAELLQ